MASWRIRFHDKWPHLASLYASTHNLDEEGKHPDPVMGQDNVFDPSEPYGAYRYYIQPTARSEFSMEEPPYVNRPVYKDEESRSSDYTSGASLRRGSTCRVLLCVFLTLSFIGVVVAAITLAVLLSKTPRSSRATQGSIEEYESMASLLRLKFNETLLDKNSDDFKKLETEVCLAMEQIFQETDSPVQKEFSGCNVIEFNEEGTTLVTFRIQLVPKSAQGFKPEYRIRQKMEDYFAKKIKEHGPWLSVNLDPNFSRRFVEIEPPKIRTTTTTTSTTAAITEEITQTAVPEEPTQRTTVQDSVTGASATPGSTDQIMVTETDPFTNKPTETLGPVTEIDTTGIVNVTDTIKPTGEVEATTQDVENVTFIYATTAVPAETHSTDSDIRHVSNRTETIPIEITTFGKQPDVTTDFVNITEPPVDISTDLAPEITTTVDTLTNQTTIYPFDNVTLSDVDMSTTQSVQEETTVGNITIVDPITKPLSTQTVDQTTYVPVDTKITTPDTMMPTQDVTQTATIDKGTTETMQITSEGFITPDSPITKSKTTDSTPPVVETTEVTQAPDMTIVKEQTTIEISPEVTTTQAIPEVTSQISPNQTTPPEPPLTSRVPVEPLTAEVTTPPSGLTSMQEATTVIDITADITTTTQDKFDFSTQETATQTDSSLKITTIVGTESVTTVTDTNTTNPSLEIETTTTAGNVTEFVTEPLSVTTIESASDTTKAFRRHTAQAIPDLTTLDYVDITTMSTLPVQPILDTRSTFATADRVTTESVTVVTDQGSTTTVQTVDGTTIDIVNVTSDFTAPVNDADITTSQNIADVTTEASTIIVETAADTGVTLPVTRTISEKQQTSEKPVAMSTLDTASVTDASTLPQNVTQTFNETVASETTTGTVVDAYQTSTETPSVTATEGVTRDIVTSTDTAFTVSDVTEVITGTPKMNQTAGVQVDVTTIQIIVPSTVPTDNVTPVEATTMGVGSYTSTIVTMNVTAPPLDSTTSSLAIDTVTTLEVTNDTSTSTIVTGQDVTTAQDSIASTAHTDIVTTNDTLTVEISTLAKDSVTTLTPDGTTVVNDTKTTETPAATVAADQTTVFPDVTTDGIVTGNVTIDAVTLIDSFTTATRQKEVTSPGGVETTQQDAGITTTDSAGLVQTTASDGTTIQTPSGPDQTTMGAVTTPGIKITSVPADSTTVMPDAQTTDSMLTVSKTLTTVATNQTEPSTEQPNVTQMIDTLVNASANETLSDTTTLSSNETFTTPTDSVTPVFETTALNDSLPISDSFTTADGIMGNLTTASPLPVETVTHDTSMASETSNPTSDVTVTSSQTENVTRDGRVTSSPTENVTSDVTVTSSQTENVTRDGRVTSSPTENVTSDVTVTSSQTENVTSDSAVTVSQTQNVTSAATGASTEMPTKSDMVTVVAGSTELPLNVTDFADFLNFTGDLFNLTDLYNFTTESPESLNVTELPTTQSPTYKSTAQVGESQTSPDGVTTIGETQLPQGGAVTGTMTQSVTDGVAATTAPPVQQTTVTLINATNTFDLTLNDTLTDLFNVTDFPLFYNITDLDLLLLNTTELNFSNETSTQAGFSTHMNGSSVDNNIVNTQFNATFVGSNDANVTAVATDSILKNTDNTTAASAPVLPIV